MSCIQVPVFLVKHPNRKQQQQQQVSKTSSSVVEKQNDSVKIEPYTSTSETNSDNFNNINGNQKPYLSPQASTARATVDSNSSEATARTDGPKSATSDAKSSFAAISTNNEDEEDDDVVTTTALDDEDDDEDDEAGRVNDNKLVGRINNDQIEEDDEDEDDEFELTEETLIVTNPKEDFVDVVDVAEPSSSSSLMLHALTNEMMREKLSPVGEKNVKIYEPPLVYVHQAELSTCEEEYDEQQQPMVMRPCDHDSFFTYNKIRLRIVDAAAATPTGAAVVQRLHNESLPLIESFQLVDQNDEISEVTTTAATTTTANKSIINNSVCCWVPGPNGSSQLRIEGRQFELREYVRSSDGAACLVDSDNRNRTNLNGEMMMMMKIAKERITDANQTHEMTIEEDDDDVNNEAGTSTKRDMNHRSTADAVVTSAAVAEESTAARQQQQQQQHEESEEEIKSISSIEGSLKAGLGNDRSLCGNSSSTPLICLYQNNLG